MNVSRDDNKMRHTHTHSSECHRPVKLHVAVLWQWCVVLFEAKWLTSQKMKHEEALTSEEGKYPSGVRSLPLPKPVCFAALLNDDGSKFKAQIWPIQQTTPLQLGQGDNAKSAVVCTKAWNTSATNSLLLETQSLPACLHCKQLGWWAILLWPIVARESLLHLFVYSHFVIVYCLFV